ncbi:MAG TPA: family 20 glycosylhydrolase [Acidimicrobiales bacterium]|nr:family 20 glycosylhydrolase [Acidimicrobiales bacterium]
MILWPPPQRLDLRADAQPSNEPLPPQGYRIVVRDGAATVEAADAAGARYAASTLAQLGRDVVDGVIEDWPAIAVRGAMLDVSRCRVPALDTVKALLARLASWKINHVELYLEHTFAYAGHDEVWRDASAYTPDELRELDDFADSVGIELTGQQNCLGHMERWLKLDRYRPLAISPDGFTTPWGEFRGPSTADPDNPATLALARDLFGQLLPNLRSRRAHVGLDEPWELSSDRSGSWIGYLQALRAAPELADHHVLVWDDVLVHHPELLRDIPTDVTICDWGYEAAQPFDERAAELKAMGLPFWLCPGTSTWTTVAGRWTNAVTNIASACTAAAANGAEGVMVTDWGDMGHIQHHVVSHPMFAWAAACAWNPAASPDDITDVIGELGEALRLLGDAHTLVGPQLFNMSILTLPMYRPWTRFGHGPATTGITVEDLQRCGAQVARARELAARASRSLERDEVFATADLLALLIDDGIERVKGDGRLGAAPLEVLADFAARTRALRAEHTRIWNLRNRPGGLDECLANYDRLLSVYVPEHHDAAGA